MTLEPFRDATGLGAVALRERALEDGYLHLPGLIPGEAVGPLRDVALAGCEAHGWLAPGDAACPRARPGARLTGTGYDDPRWVDLQCRVLAHPRFTAVGDHPRVTGVLTALFGEPPAARLGDICRLTLPGAEDLTTPPHQDHWYVGGTTEMWTCWVALVDVPEGLGPLAVAPGSHHLGLLPHEGAGAGRQGVTPPPGTRWASGSLAAGDVVFFNALTLHCALPNTTPDRLRLSVDYRYKPSGARAHIAD